MDKNIQSALLQCYFLKQLPRSGWVRHGIPNPESVAAHAWGLALLVSLFCPAHVNREKALEMAIVHDLAEAITGDITPHDGVDEEEKHARERRAMQGFAQACNAPHWLDLLDAYVTGETPEAQFVKKMDKLDMALQALAYERMHGCDCAEFMEAAKQLCPEFWP